MSQITNHESGTIYLRSQENIRNNYVNFTYIVLASEIYCVMDILVPTIAKLRLILQRTYV